MAVKRNERLDTRETQTDQNDRTRREGQNREQQQPQNDNRLARLDQQLATPFSLLQRFFTGDMASLFTELSGSRSRMSPRSLSAGPSLMAWTPKVDVVQRGNELVVRADLPGVDPDDTVVEISDDAITISGERQQEDSDEEGGVYRYERTYGSFVREIPLPEGAMIDQAQASFKDGVLEVTVPAPPEQVSRGRRLEINRGEQPKQSGASNERA